MNTAFEITPDDVATVLARHHRITDYEDPFIEECFETLDPDRVEKAALAYNDFDDQTNSALDEIETILMEENILSGPKLFHAP
jgi:hypothetical protein